MIYVKTKSDIPLPENLIHFKEKGLISVIEMLFNKENFIFLVINTSNFANAQEKRILWNLIKDKKKTIPTEMEQELLKPYGFGANVTLFPIDVSKWE